ncbi:hypothetical protein VTJ04DRAFT_5987 [Mycothermus thermophilus]|uniref:uncharacterized protein n=1 Tax=Humicola insolens TaxID=85995 RepID=UPI003742C7FF
MKANRSQRTRTEPSMQLPQARQQPRHTTTNGPTPAPTAVERAADTRQSDRAETSWRFNKQALITERSRSWRSKTSGPRFGDEERESFLATPSLKNDDASDSLPLCSTQFASAAGGSIECPPLATLLITPKRPGSVRLRSTQSAGERTRASQSASCIPCHISAHCAHWLAHFSLPPETTQPLSSWSLLACLQSCPTPSLVLICRRCCKPLGRNKVCLLFWTKIFIGLFCLAAPPLGRCAGRFTPTVHQHKLKGPEATLASRRANPAKPCPKQNPRGEPRIDPPDREPGNLIRSGLAPISPIHIVIGSPTSHTACSSLFLPPGCRTCPSTTPA